MVAHVAQHSNNQGFTLVEVLVATAIFMVIAVAANIGVQQALAVKTTTADVYSKQMELYTALTVLTNDFSQLAPRMVRNTFGQSVAAFKLGGGSLVEFTRFGVADLGLGLSFPYQRVGYSLSKKTLYRYTWPAADNIRGAKVVEVAILNNVIAASVKPFGVAAKDISSDNLEQSQQPTFTGNKLPYGVLWELNIKGIGKIERKIYAVSPLQPLARNTLQPEGTQ